MQPNEKRHAPKLIPKDSFSKEQARKQLRKRCIDRIQLERSIKRNASVTRSREMWLNAMVEQEVMRMGHIWTEEVSLLELTQEIGNIIREEYHHAMSVYEQRYSNEMGHLSLDHMLAIEEEIASESTFS